MRRAGEIRSGLQPTADEDRESSMSRTQVHPRAAEVIMLLTTQMSNGASHELFMSTAN